MKKLSLNKILIALGVLLSVVALFFLLAPGLTATVTESGITATSKIGLGGFIVGSHKAVATGTMRGTTVTLNIFYKGGMSYFVLISVILLVLGLAATIASIFLKKQGKLFALIGALLIIVAAIFILLIKCGGTNITSITYEGSTINTDTTYADFVKDSNFGAGTICYFVFALLSGLIITGSQFIPTKKLSKKRK